MKGLFLFIFLIISLLISAQVKHKVEPKETLYGLSVKYGVTQEQLIEANPFLAERGLQIGDELFIPGTSDNTTQPKTDLPSDFEDENYQYITIKAKETLYNLSKIYSISIETLQSINPSLTEGLKEGDVIRIPNKNKTNLEGYHQMAEGETLYSISRKYGLSTQDLLLANRDLQVDDIPVGAYIKIPTEGFSSEEPETEEPNFEVGGPPKEEEKPNNIKDGYFEYTVRKDDSVFGILNNFDITLEEFLAANPSIKSGVEAGEKVRIPLKNEKVFEDVASLREKDDTIRISLFLPFFLEDSSKKGQKEVSTLFLSGAKLAIDSLSGKGKKIKVDVIDSGNETLFEKTLETTKLYNNDLFVGPFYVNNILALRHKTENTSIPIVSPLVKSESLKDQPNIIFAEVDDYILADKLMDEIIEKANGQKVYILADSKKAELATYMQSKLNTHFKDILIVSNVDQILQEQNLITESMEQIVPILVTENEELGTAFIDKVDELDNETVLPFSVFYLSSFDNSKNILKLRKKGFVFVASRKVNLNGFNERKTLKRYEDEYCQSPPKYAVIGFDIVYDLISRMSENKNITSNLVGRSTTQLATKFEYEKLPSNSYENTGVRIIRYTKL